MFGRKKRDKDEPFVNIGQGYNLDAPSQRIPINLPDKYRTGHVFGFGTTRSGKTRLIENMIESDIRKGYSVVLIDPKGDQDIFAKIIQVAAETGRLDDLMLINPIFPNISASINPLHYYYMPEELVGHLVSGVETGKEPFFYNVAYETSLIIVQAYLLLAKMETGSIRFNFNDVKNIVSHNDLQELLNRLKSVETEEAKAISMDLQKIVDSGQDYYNKVSSSLRVALMELTQGNIGELVGKARENRIIERLQSKKGVILVAQLGSLITRKSAFTLGKVIISMLQAYIGRVFASGEKVDPPLSVYMDEAQNVLYHGIDDFFAKAGGANVYLHGFCQSINQIFAEIGEQYGNSILDNTNTKIFLKVPDKTTALYIVEHFGETHTMSPIMSVGGQMSLRESNEETLKTTDLLYLKPRLFYMMSYHGRFKGITADVEDSIIKPIYPSADTVVEEDDQVKNVNIKDV